MKSRLLGAVSVCVLMFSPLLGVAADFSGLGTLGGGSAAQGISADGSTVVGNSSEAFRWTAAGGMAGISDSSYLALSASAVSGDGSTVVGGLESTDVDGAYIWTVSEGFTDLGALLEEPFGDARATGISPDGSTVVGVSNSSRAEDGEAFIWTAAGGMVGLGDLPPRGLPAGIDSVATGVSADGTTVVGLGNAVSYTEAFFWTEADGMIGLGFLPGQSSGVDSSRAEGISADGTRVIGSSDSTLGLQAFIWTNEDGMVGLGDLPGGEFRSWGWGISDDGSTVVGQGTTALGSEAFVWDEDSGMRAVADVLAAEGIDVSDWTLLQATDVSADGSMIVGSGINPDGNYEAWIANTNVIPIPPAVWLFGSGLIGLVGVARRRAQG